MIYLTIIWKKKRANIFRKNYTLGELNYCERTETVTKQLWLATIFIVHSAWGSIKHTEQQHVRIWFSILGKYRKKIKKNVFNVHFGWGRQSCLHLEGKLIFLTRKFNVLDKYYARSGLIYFIFWSLQKHTADGRPTISAHPGNYNSTLSIWYLRIWFVKHYLQLIGISMVW